MVDVDALQNLIGEVVSNIATVPDDEGIIYADTGRLVEATEAGIGRIGPIAEPSGFLAISKIEHSLDDLFADINRVEETIGTLYDAQGRPKSISPKIEYKESPVLDIKIKPEPKTVSTVKESKPADQAVKQTAISSRLLDVSPRAAELVSVKEPEGAVLRITKPVDEYLKSVGSMAAELVAGIKTISPGGSEPISYISPEKLQAIKDLSAELSASIGVLPDSGKIEYISPQALQGLQSASQELQRAEALASTANQYVHIQSVDAEGKGYPETEEELLANYRKALAKYNPAGEKDGTNEIIAKYFPGAIPGIIARQVDVSAIVNLCYKYSSYKDGDVDTSSATYVPGTGYVGKKTKPAFRDLSDSEQKDVLCEFLREGANTGTDPGFTMSLVWSLVKSEDSTGQRENLESYLLNGDVDKDLTAFASGRRDIDVLEWVKSRDAQLTVGAAFGIIGAAGGFLVAGPAGALVGVGMIPFATTEFANLYGMDPFRLKSELQSKGLYGPDVAMQYDQNYAAISDSIDMLKFQGDKLSPEKRKELIAQIDEGLKKLGNQLGDNAVFLAAIREYDYEVDRINNLKDQYDLLGSTLDPTTGKWAVTTDEPARIVIKPPEEGSITSDEWGGTSTKAQVLHKTGEGSFTYEIRDRNNYLVGSKTVYYKNGESKEYDESEALSDQTVWEENIAQSKDTGVNINETDFFGMKGIKEPAATTKGFVLYLEPMQTARIADKEYMGMEDIPTKYVLFGTPGERMSIEFSEPGKESKVVNTWIQESGLQVISQPLTESFLDQLKQTQEMQKKAAAEKQEAESKAWYSPTVLKGQILYVDGKLVQVPADGSPIQIAPGTHSYVIKQPGKQDVIGSFTVFGGDTFALAGQGKDPYASSGGGGGGGGGGGSYSGGGSTKKTTTTTTEVPQNGWIKFTASAASSKIWLDDVEVSVTAGQSYTIDQGYHSIRMELAGKLPWSKSVYVGAGDTITVSPLWEDDLDYGTEPDPGPVIINLPQQKRVYISSNPSGAKVVVDGVATGEWTPCYLDMDPGYYVVGFIKSGYLQTELSLYVGESIAWGDLADSLAIAAGLI